MTRDRIASSVGRPPAFADHMGVALGEAGVLRRIRTGIHAGQDRELPRGRQGEVALVAELAGVLGIGREHLVENGHG